MSAEPDEAFATLVRDQIVTAYGFWWHGDQLHYHSPGRRRRCPACSPAGYTPKLCIDGREYRRRQQARRRR